MNHILVTDYHPPILKRLKSQAVVVRTSDLFAFRSIAHEVNEFNKLHGISAFVKGKLSDIPVAEDWGNLPISLFVPEFGDTRTFIRKAGLWRSLPVRIFLSSQYAENFTHLQVIASLGVDCGLWFDGEPVDWQAADDLLHYAIYGKVPHAMIEPFVYLVDRYSPTARTDFSSVYFNNPERYLHLDSSGNLALTDTDLKAGEFIGTLDDLPGLEESPTYKEALNRWQEVFLSNETCASCPSWRVCLGKFSQLLEKDQGCIGFFQDVMEAAEFVQGQSKQRRVKELCQL